MFRGLSRPLGVVLLAVLAAAPVVRTLCGWECGPSPAPRGAVATPEQGGHCAQTADHVEAGAAGLMSVSGCGGCDLGGTLRATVRTETAALATSLLAPAWAAPGHALRSPDPARGSTRAASPPLRAPYPLRI
jgi:hypothetical protein